MHLLFEKRSISLPTKSLDSMSQQQKSGLDIDLGNLCSKDAFNWAKSTFSNRQGKSGAAALQVDGAFSNMLVFGNQRIGIASDGKGTGWIPGTTILGVVNKSLIGFAYFTNQ